MNALEEHAKGLHDHGLACVDCQQCHNQGWHDGNQPEGCPWCLPVTPPDDPAERDRLALNAIEEIVNNDDLDWSDELESIYSFIEWSGRKVG